VEQGRVVSRADRLIALKRQRTIQPMPGLLLTQRAEEPRAALPPGARPAPPCAPVIGAVTASNAEHFRFTGEEHFSKEASEGRAGQATAMLRAWLVDARLEESGVPARSALLTVWREVATIGVWGGTTGAVKGCLQVRLQGC
jgi:hypothetical protein